MKEMINYPGRAVGCERIVKDKLEIILGGLSLASTPIFLSMRGQNRKHILALRAKSIILDGLSIVKD